MDRRLHYWAVLVVAQTFALAAVAPAKQSPAGPAGTTADGGQKAEERPIQDNSFLVEEAYNQEYAVVQHINGFQRVWPSGQWAYSFTQEWPVDPAPRHQLSYTVPVVGAGGSLGTGIGDIALNYRYQLIGSGEARVAFAPRFSLLLPTGDYRAGRGAGAVGCQGSLPLSIVLNKRIVTHWNLGTTIVPGQKNALGERSTTYGYNLGQSFVWLVHPRFNMLFETVWVRAEAVVGAGRTAPSHSLFVSPGIRWAHNLPGGLQIVPGVAAPIGIGPSSGEKGIFLYLSIEHPFKKLKRD